MTSISLLHHMIIHADRVRPWGANELSTALSMPLSTTYRNLRSLCRHNLIQHVVGGYLLGQPILDAGVKFQMALSKMKNRPEELYGKAKQRNH